MTARRFALLLVAAIAAASWWWRKHPSPCPYGQRWALDLPRPFITVERLRDVLAVEPGERVLEIGPGSGHYALPVARWLMAGGQLDVVDIQQEMLDLVAKRARESNVANIVPTQGNALELPYGEATFDAVYLVTVLGEIPDTERALSEIHRVLKPGGRLVVGEVALDPHFVTLGSLRAGVEARGLSFERRSGNGFGYFARFTRASG